jgi:hypothetical protein
MAPRKPLSEQHDEPALAFDVTQEIDASLADELRRTDEPTLSQVDFDEATVVLPKKSTPT